MAAARSIRRQSRLLKLKVLSFLVLRNKIEKFLTDDRRGWQETLRPWNFVLEVRRFGCGSPLPVVFVVPGSSTVVTAPHESVVHADAVEQRVGQERSETAARTAAAVIIVVDESVTAKSATAERRSVRPGIGRAEATSRPVRACRRLDVVRENRARTFGVVRRWVRETRRVSRWSVAAEWTVG